MKNIKTFGSLLLAMVGCFTLGGYTYASVRHLEVIDPHRWVMTILFSLMFLGFFLIDYRNKSIIK